MKKNKIKKQDIIKLIIVFTIIAIFNEINFTNKPKSEAKTLTLATNAVS